MTRAKEKPTRRVVRTMDGELVVEVTERYCTLRPLGTRKGGKAEHSVTWGGLYLRLVEADVLAKLAAKRKARRQGKR